MTMTIIVKMSGHNTLPGPRKKFLFTKYLFKEKSQPNMSISAQNQRKKKTNNNKCFQK